MADKFYVTTAIDYSNGSPHLGHAFEKIGADCIARYRRLKGHRVSFVIGMDEHGQKVAQSAEEAGARPQDWVDGIAAEFQEAWNELAISHTDFIRTTEARHTRAVQALLSRIHEAGFIEPGVYSGYYCVGCEAFKLEKDLVDGKCPEHPTRDVKWVDEPNFFFKLGAFRDRLLQTYEASEAAGRPFVQPTSKFNEIKNVVRDWQPDYSMSVSRSRVPWGIPWPGDETHTIYVWFDALINYLSATGFPDPGFEDTWPAEVHIIGPDIVRFHAAIWPAMLMAAGIPIPRSVWCHGWINTAGARFSKSAGVSLTLRNAIDRHGPDALRYFLLREVPWDADGNFSWERLDIRYTSELADGYGNLTSRILSMISRYRSGTVPDATQETELDRAGDSAIQGFQRAMDQHLLHQGGDAAWGLVSRANQFVEEEAPWSLAKEGKTEDLDRVLASLARSLTRITLMASPFMPEKTRVVWQGLGFKGSPSEAGWKDLSSPRCGGHTVTRIPPLFPKPEVVK